MKLHRDLEHLTEAIFELESIPNKCMVSFSLLRPLPYHLSVTLAALSDTDTLHPTKPGWGPSFPCKPEGG